MQCNAPGKEAGKKIRRRATTTATVTQQQWLAMIMTTNVGSALLCICLHRRQRYFAAVFVTLNNSTICDMVVIIHNAHTGTHRHTHNHNT